MKHSSVLFLTYFSVSHGFDCFQSDNDAKKAIAKIITVSYYSLSVLYFIVLHTCQINVADWILLRFQSRAILQSLRCQGKSSFRYAYQYIH